MVSCTQHARMHAECCQRQWHFFVVVIIVIVVDNKWQMNARQNERHVIICSHIKYYVIILFTVYVHFHNVCCV